MKILALVATLLLVLLGATHALVPVRPHHQARIRNLLQVPDGGAPPSSSTLVVRHAGAFFRRWSGQNEAEVVAPPPLPRKPQYDYVTIDPDFRVAGLFLAIGIVLDQIPYVQWTLGLFTTLLGVLFLVQTFRIRFVFDEDNCLELKTTALGSDSVEGAAENIIVGGANRWACDAIVNYDFFPQGWIDDNPVGPILVYFKETQTPEETWNEGPGQSANDPQKIAAGQAVAGQVHFFPTVCNAQQIRAEFEKRGCQKINAK